MKVNFITGQIKEKSGLSRYAEEVFEGFNDKKELFKLEFRKKSFIHKFLMQFVYYPLKIRKQSNGCINHITRQDFAFVLNYGKIENSIVTCHDLWPLVNKKKEGLFKRLFVWFWLRGLKKAEYLISVSENTKKDMVNLLGIPEDKIFVTHEGINSLFRLLKVDDAGLRKKFNTPKKNKVILYVGSETPRKNFITLIKAFSELKKEYKNCTLLKVGGSQSIDNRKRANNLIENLSLVNDVIFVGHVSDEELPVFYNFADIFVFPTKYEGFGFPVLEAMACGCPVIASNNSSIPEIAGNAAILIKPEVVDLKDQMLNVLMDNALKKKLRQKGLKRAGGFTWKNTLKNTQNVYKRIK